MPDIPVAGLLFPSGKFLAGGKAGQLAAASVSPFRAASPGFDGAGFFLFHDHDTDTVVYQFEDLLTPKKKKYFMGFISAKEKPKW